MAFPKLKMFLKRLIAACGAATAIGSVIQFGYWLWHII